MAKQIYTANVSINTALLFGHTEKSKSIARHGTLVVRIFCSMTCGELRNATGSGFAPQPFLATPTLRHRLSLCPDSLLSRPEQSGPRLSAQILVGRCMPICTGTCVCASVYGIQACSFLVLEVCLVRR